MDGKLLKNGKTMSNKKNILLITIDSLRADHLSCLGYYRETTPCIDNLAQNGFLFTQAIANGPETSTSVPALLTSTHPLMYGYHPHLSKSKTTVAEVLRDDGYNTAAFHSNPFLSKHYGYDRGFDTFQDFMFFKSENRANKMGSVNSIMGKILNLSSFLRRAYGFVSSPVLRGLQFVRPLYPPYTRADLINQEAVLWLRQHIDNFFLWMHYMDVHFPYQPPAQYLRQLQIKVIGKSQITRLNDRLDNGLRNNMVQFSDIDLQKLVDLYDGGIKYTDSAVNSLLMELKKLGAYDDTLIIITADHGDEFNEHGQLGHHAKLYDELIHVPLVIKWPNLDGNIVIDQQAQLLDIAPTILEFSGSIKPANFQGNSLLSLIEGKGIAMEGVISETIYDEKIGNKGIMARDGIGKRRTSYRTKEWKYIIDEATKRDELYNLQNDPKEKRNLVDKETEKAAEFGARITEHIHTEQESKEAVTKAEKERIKLRIKNLKT